MKRERRKRGWVYRITLAVVSSMALSVIAIWWLSYKWEIAVVLSLPNNQGVMAFVDEGVFAIDGVSDALFRWHIETVIGRLRTGR